MTGDWQSILHIGNSDYQRLPGIWFHPFDISVGTAFGSATYTTTGAAVNVRGPWHSSATKATLSDIYLKEIAAPTP